MKAHMEPTPGKRIPGGKKVETIQSGYGDWKQVYTLKLTDFEVQVMFRRMVRNWFARQLPAIMAFYVHFLKVMWKR